MDTELAALLPHLPAPDITDPAAARQDMRGMLEMATGGRRPSWTQRVEITSTDVPAPDGHPIPVRIYRPQTATSPRGALVHFHGGAFVSGDLGLSEYAVGRMADLADVVVIDVDYRLAPEHRFPVGFEDCYAVLEWTAKSTAELGIDPARIAVGGDSAGGALAAAVALAARDRGGPSIAYQLLLYPVLDDRLRTRSVQEMVGVPMWDSPNTVLMWDHYLGPQSVRGVVSPYAAPMRAAEAPGGLSGLPSAYILACEFDPLRDEEIEYAAALLAAGVSVELHVVPGTFHGFENFPTQISKRATAEYCDALRRAVGG